MEQLNHIELKGHVGAVRLTDGSYGKEATFSLATNLLYTDREGNTQVETTWHNVVAEEGAGIAAELLENIKRGCLVHITGRVRNGHITAADGKERACPQVVAETAEILDDGKPKCPFCGSGAVYVRAYVHAGTKEYYNGSADCGHACCGDCLSEFALEDWELN